VRPRVKVPLTLTDKILEGAAFFVLLTLIVLPFLYFQDLPERIPSHYNHLGEPDGFSGEGIIFSLPAIGFILYLGMTWLN